MRLNDGILSNLLGSCAGIQDRMELEAVILSFHLLEHSDTDLQEWLTYGSFFQTDRAEFFSRATYSIMSYGIIFLKPWLSIVAAAIFDALKDSRPVKTGGAIITLLSIRSMKGYLQSIVRYRYHYLAIRFLDSFHSLEMTDYSLVGNSVTRRVVQPYGMSSIHTSSPVSSPSSR